MTHFDGSQEQDLLQTATFIVTNPSTFTDPIIRWSQAFVDGGLPNTTYQELLSREDITVTPVTSFGNVILQEPQDVVIPFTTTLELEQLQFSQLAELGDIAVAQQNSINANREFISDVNTRLSAQVVELGKSLTQQANDDAFGGISTFFGGLGVGSLAVLAVIAVLVFRKGL